MFIRWRGARRSSCPAGRFSAVDVSQWRRVGPIARLRACSIAASISPWIQRPPARGRSRLWFFCEFSAPWRAIVIRNRQRATAHLTQIKKLRAAIGHTYAPAIW